jgi:hypothetical protein
MSHLLSLSHAAMRLGTPEWVLDLAMRNGTLETTHYRGERYISYRALRAWRNAGQ